MNNQITDKQLEVLEGFIGYGKLNAEIIFFGIEEAGGGYENLKMRFSMDKYEYLDCKRFHLDNLKKTCLLYTSPSPRDAHESRMPSSA